ISSNTSQPFWRLTFPASSSLPYGGLRLTSIRQSPSSWRLTDFTIPLPTSQSEMTRKRRGFDTPSKGLPFRHWGDGGDATFWGSDGFAALNRTIGAQLPSSGISGPQDSAAE